MEPTLGSETSAYKIQTPGKFPEDYTLQIVNSSTAAKNENKIALLGGIYDIPTFML
jgi:hypothetical protein